MAEFDSSELPLLHRLALSHTPIRARSVTRALLVLDTRLARLVAGANEPLLGQMRLAWWREQLAKPDTERTKGDPALAALDGGWAGEAPALVALVDGWENLLGGSPLEQAAMMRFAEGRGAAFAALARIVAEPGAASSARAAGSRWALADLHFGLSDPLERERCRSCYRALGTEAIRLPTALRGLAILDLLGRRAMARGTPPLSARGDALAAMRLGLLGR